MTIAVPGKPPQWFTFGPWAFDITAATRLLAAAPRPARPLPVSQWARAYGLIPDPNATPGSVPLIGPGPHFDTAYAMTTNLNDPVLIASIPTETEPPYALLIDGYALPVTVRSEAAAVHRSVPEPVRLTIAADLTMR